MRANDLAVPAVPVDGHPRPVWMRGRLVVALERLPQSAYVWDDDAQPPDEVVWDDPDPDRFVWDAPFVGSGYSDAWCDLVSLELSVGEPTTDDLFFAARAELVVRDPGDGRYRARNADGTLTWWALGRRLAVYWLDEADVPWWLFSGTIATWRDTLLTPDVAISAFGPCGTLGAGRIGSPWTAGGAGQFPGARAVSILNATDNAALPHRFDLGDVPLDVPAANAGFPLDAMRQAYWSDGGIVHDDADGAVVGRDRRWRAGRADQTSVPVLTSNVCDDPAAVVVWDPTLDDVDLRLATDVELTSQGGLTAVAAVAAPTAPPSTFRHPGPDLWQTQAAGNALAAHIAGYVGNATAALAPATVHLHDIRFDYWAQMLDRRIGDLVRFQHRDRFVDPPRDELYDLTMVLTTIRHHITADTWTVDVGTTPAVSYTAVELWDLTSLVWDDTNPLAVWR